MLNEQGAGINERAWRITVTPNLQTILKLMETIMRNTHPRVNNNLTANLADLFLTMWQGPLGPNASDAERKAAATHDVDTAMAMTNPANAILDLFENYVCTYADLTADPNALDHISARRDDLLALMAALRERATPYNFNDVT